MFNGCRMSSGLRVPQNLAHNFETYVYSTNFSSAQEIQTCKLFSHSRAGNEVGGQTCVSFSVTPELGMRWEDRHV